MSKARVGTTQDPNLYTDVAAMRETVVKCSVVKRRYGVYDGTAIRRVD